MLYYLINNPEFVKNSFHKPADAILSTSGSILLTKLHRPPINRDHGHRQRLLVYLDQRRDRPLTLVSAPAGKGKSVLLSR
jgi:hypothetical protein